MMTPDSKEPVLKDAQIAELLRIPQTDEAGLRELQNGIKVVRQWLLNQKFGEEDAKDIIQEALLGIWKSSPKYDIKKSSVQTWMHRILRYKEWDSYRTHSRWPPITSLSDEEESVQNEPSLQTSPFDDLHKDIETVLSKYGHRLTEQEMEVLRQTFEATQEPTNAEIAERLSISTSYTGNLKHLGLKKLEKGIVEQGKSVGCFNELSQEEQEIVTSMHASKPSNLNPSKHTQPHPQTNNADHNNATFKGAKPDNDELNRKMSIYKSALRKLYFCIEKQTNH